MKQEDVDLAIEVVRSAGEERDRMSLLAVIDAALQHGLPAGVVLSDLLERYNQHRASVAGDATVGELLGGWCQTLMAAADTHFAQNQSSDRVGVWGYVLTMAASSAFAQGISLEDAQALLASVYVSVQQELGKVAPAAEPGPVPDFEPKPLGGS